MSPGAAETTVAERDLLERARGGSEDAFNRLVEARRGELQAHCYRMLGSVHDAEDALQDAMLRAWKALSKFEGRSSVRSWLYRIATNTCLDVIAKRPKRVLPIDYGPKTDPHDGPGKPVAESAWIEPYPDEELGLEDGYAAPDARYEQREAVELAFVAALQHLPANQRAVLILREVLGFSANEVADALDTTTASVNSAMQRARKTVDEKLPDQSQQETLRTLGDEKLKELVSGYADAWERGDIETIVSMFSKDVTFAMPPMSTWFGGVADVEAWMRDSPLSGRFKWKSLPASANGQPALGFYSWDEQAGAYIPFAMNVLTFDGEEIADVTAFISRSSQDPDPEIQRDSPNIPADLGELGAVYEAFGLPPRLD